MNPAFSSKCILTVFKKTFLCPRINRLGAYSFWPACLSVCLFVCQQKFYIGHSFCMVHDRAFIFHISVPRGKTLSLYPASSLTETSILYTDGYTEGPTEGLMDGRTDRLIPVYPENIHFAWV